jgi:hypothetical protein
MPFAGLPALANRLLKAANRAAPTQGLWRSGDVLLSARDVASQFEFELERRGGYSAAPKVTIM